MMSKWKTPWRDPKFFYSFWGVFQDIFHLKGQLTKFVTSEAVKALGVFIGVFSCDIIDGPQRKYLKKSLNHFVLFLFLTVAPDKEARPNPFKCQPDYRI